MRWFQVLDSREVYPDSGLDMLPIPEARFAQENIQAFGFGRMPVCVRLASMPCKQCFVLAIYRCISDIRREGEECA